MKKILVPIDFSDCSINAMKYAINLAKKTNTVLHFIHMVELDYSFIAGSAFGAKFSNIEDENKPVGQMREVFEKADELLMDIISGQSENISMVSSVLQGDLIGEAMNYIDNKGIDMVVMGSHGQRGLNRMLLGSNAQKMIRYSKVPVIIVKETSETNSLKNIVYTSDFKEENLNDSLPYVKSISEFYNSSLHLLYVNTPNRFEDTDVVDERINQAIKTHSLDSASYSTFNSSWIEEGIIKYSQLNPTDLLVINTHGFKGIKQLFHHSIAESVVNNCEVPVMIINKN